MAWTATNIARPSTVICMMGVLELLKKPFAGMVAKGKMQSFLTNYYLKMIKKPYSVF